MTGPLPKCAVPVALGLLPALVCTLFAPCEAVAQTYMIAGTILDGTTGSGVPGVQVTATLQGGGTQGTAVTAGTGVYLIFDLPAGTYTVTPERAGYTFSPASLTVTVNEQAGDRSDADFTATQLLYTISGQVTHAGVGLAGVAVSDGYRQDTTAADGTYALTNVSGGTYVVTPSHDQYTFTPSHRRITVPGPNLDAVDFAASVQTYTISGSVTDPNGVRMQGVRITLVGGQSVAVTSAAGLYTLAGVPAGTVELAAELAGFTVRGQPRSDGPQRHRQHDRHRYDHVPHVRKPP